MTLNLLSLNVHGLRNQEKRRQIFEQYRQRCDILCLQETHSTEECEDIWHNEWGGEIIFSHGTSSARGTAILTKKNSASKIKIKLVHKSDDGRSITVIVTINDTDICVNNIYAKIRHCFFTLM